MGNGRHAKIEFEDGRNLDVSVTIEASVADNRLTYIRFLYLTYSSKEIVIFADRNRSDYRIQSKPQVVEVIRGDATCASVGDAVSILQSENIVFACRKKDIDLREQFIRGAREFADHILEDINLERPSQAGLPLQGYKVLGRNL